MCAFWQCADSDVAVDKDQQPHNWNNPSKTYQTDGSNVYWADSTKQSICHFHGSQLFVSEFNLHVLEVPSARSNTPRDTA